MRRGISTPPMLYATPSQGPLAVCRRYPFLDEKLWYLLLFRSAFYFKQLPNFMQFLLLGTVVLKSATVELRYNESLYNEVLGITNDFLYPSNNKIYEKELRYNESLYNEVLGITNDFLYPSNNKIYEKELRCNETSL